MGLQFHSTADVLELIAAVKSALSATTPLWHRLYHFFLVIEVSSNCP